MVPRRIFQSISLVVFLVLLWFAAFPLILPVPVDLFLRMDPMVLVTTLTVTRRIVPVLLLAAAIVGLTFVFGRFFCSMVCPLGTTVDITDRLIRRSPGAEDSRSPTLRLVKYLVLCFVIAAALLGVSLAFLASPISLATRLYGLLVYPVFSLATNAGLTLIRPLAEPLGIDALAYAGLASPRFALQWLTVAILGGVFACGLLAPRFWCRYLCPAGAVFALASLRPLLKRRVSPECTSCGLCREKCPMDAIAEDPHVTDGSECISCRTCVRVCPVDAVRFSFSPRGLLKRTIRFSAHRRALILSGMAGLGTALVALTSLKGMARESVQGQVADPSLIRPPGAVPEPLFRGKCVGCGECMKTCPTNTLQPAGLAAGLSGLMSPVIVPRRGPCDPACAACGQVCPTSAIRPLPLDEKRYAKVGTAYVIPHKCIAWEFGRPCLVCDEVCPYGAVELKTVEGISVAVPFVDETKCNGCGFCEYYCPVQARSAIVVEPMDELRLEKGSYLAMSRELGLSFEPKKKQGRVRVPEIPEGSLPPGFTQ
ncbi:MAG: 4Fe-4S binding protein [Syntrophaceae bacterium]